MDKSQIQDLMKHGCLPDSCGDPELRETHISWIVITDNFAFKIKRPVKLPFLDFSTLEKRSYYCHREVELNRRLAPEMYLKVIAITSGMLTGCGDSDDLVDYAVMMKKMDNRREMGELLRRDQVSGEAVDRLAEKIAHFHKHTEIISDSLDVAGFQRDYAELLDHCDFVNRRLGGELVARMRESVASAADFLGNNRRYIDERIARGLRKDCHGDLCSHNIFLYDDPIIFDCIEFNENFRRIDVLNEVAFLCMDFDFFDKPLLGERFYQKYISVMRLADDPADRRLLDFYKSYRANIRAKVYILHVDSGAVKPEKVDGMLGDIRKYIELMHDCVVRSRPDAPPQ